MGNTVSKYYVKICINKLMTSQHGWLEAKCINKIEFMIQFIEGYDVKGCQNPCMSSKFYWWKEIKTPTTWFIYSSGQQFIRQIDNLLTLIIRVLHTSMEIEQHFFHAKIILEIKFLTKKWKDKKDAVIHFSHDFMLF